MKCAGLLVVLALLMAAPPASATTTVRWGDLVFPPIYGNSRYIVVEAGDGANHDIVVKPTGAQQLGGLPQKVEIYDYGDTFELPAAPYASYACPIDSPHHVTCAASGPPANPDNPYSYLAYATIAIGTGSGNDSIDVSDSLNPMIVTVNSGAGDDNVSISGMWSAGGGKYGSPDTLGDGNDVAKLGAAPIWQAPLGGLAGGLPGGSLDGQLLSGGAGDDNITSVNGAIDHISCGDGNDTWLSDPTDDQQTYAYQGPPDTNGDCEQHTPSASP